LSINKDIEIRSEEVQEILGTPPRWIIRWGITIMLMVVIVLVSGSYFYKYPDLITARITILSEYPPVQIVARSNGKLDQLFVANNQVVEDNQVLGVIENTASYADAYRLLEALEAVRPFFDDTERFRDLSFSEDFSLGQYHSYYSSFISQLRSYQTFLSFNPYSQRVESLQKQVSDYHNYFDRSREQISVLRQDFELAYNQFYRDSTLYRQHIMSEVDYEKSKGAMLKQKYTYQNAMTGLANTQITMNNLRQQIQEQEVLKAEAGSQQLAALKERYDNLTNQLKTWEQSFILITPIAGQVTFTNIWSANQNIIEGNVVFTVVPLKDQEIIGRATIPIAGAGKVDENQRVNIKLDNYPHMEYGIVEGRVTNISKVPVTSDQGAYYTAEIALVKKLVTNYNKDLPFNQEMQGNAEIITKDRRLIERLLEPLVSVFRERI
jgi:multidrug resistance efflux pump